jgi:hypothetical protein
VLLSALVLRHARRRGLGVNIGDIGYLCAVDVVVTVSKARGVACVHVACVCVHRFAPRAGSKKRPGTAACVLQRLFLLTSAVSRFFVHARALRLTWRAAWRCQGPVRRLTAAEASYTGPLRTLFAWAAAVVRARRGRARAVPSSGAAPAPPGTPSATQSHGAARLRLPVTLRGVHITVQPRPRAAGGAAAPSSAPSSAAPTPTRTPPPHSHAPRTPATPPAALQHSLSLARAGSLHAHRRLLSSGRFRLASRVARLFEVTLLDVTVDVLPPEHAPATDGGDGVDALGAAPAEGVRVRIECVALCALAPGSSGGGGALRLSAHAAGASLRRCSTMGDATDADAPSGECDAPKSTTQEACGGESRTRDADGAMAALAWLELSVEFEHDAAVGTTSCTRLDLDAGAAAATLTAEDVAALRCVACACACMSGVFTPDSTSTHLHVSGICAGRVARSRQRPSRRRRCQRRSCLRRRLRRRTRRRRGCQRARPCACSRSRWRSAAHAAALAALRRRPTPGCSCARMVRALRCGAWFFAFR